MKSLINMNLVRTVGWVSPISEILYLTLEDPCERIGHVKYVLFACCFYQCNSHTWWYQIRRRGIDVAPLPTLQSCAKPICKAEMAQHTTELRPIPICTEGRVILAVVVINIVA